MRLQDKDWVFRKEADQRFKQVEVHTDGVTADGLQEIQDGSIQAGEQIILNALEFSTAMADQGK